MSQYFFVASAGQKNEGGKKKERARPPRSKRRTTGLYSVVVKGKKKKSALADTGEKRKKGGRVSRKHHPVEPKGRGKENNGPERGKEQGEKKGNGNFPLICVTSKGEGEKRAAELFKDGKKRERGERRSAKFGIFLPEKKGSTRPDL